jgi:hypothetical protein
LIRGSFAIHGPAGGRLKPAAFVLTRPKPLGRGCLGWKPETDLPLKGQIFHREAENRLFRRPREEKKLNFK